ncbi:disks large 1 tumor suppressor protein-like [Phyllopteryx taeniolatus]|uniref:disks large 1 tumor suppressor protein-like n=1 Tax=Phyllopteryx taeniolatus TaxID=161469 RepID=UPI002AD3AEF3|nr:disks large 1 tumor suppressor protein-like [Phyllopteryx taeniolatus]
MVHKYDTKRAAGLLKCYQASLTSPDDQALKTSVGKVSAILGSQLFQALLDIQECYEVTLQLNTQQSVLKEEKESEKEAWEKPEEEKEEEEGVSRVRVTCRGIDHKLERVCGLVTRSHIDAPKVVQVGLCNKAG